MRDWFPQTVLAGAVMVPVGAVLLISLGGVYDGFVNLLGLVLVPAMASFLLISVALVLGSPLRFVASWRSAWRARRWLSPSVAGIGLVLVVGSRVFATPGFVEDELGNRYESFSPQPVLLVAGSLLLAFGLVHTWFSREQASHTTPAQPVGSFRLDLGTQSGPQLFASRGVLGDDERVLRRMLATAGVTAVPIVTLFLSSGSASLPDLLLTAGFIYVGAMLVVGVAFVLGLPLRLIRRAGEWWAAHSWLSWAIAGAGVVVIALARVAFATQDVARATYTPQPAMAVIGIVVFAFGVLHIYRPRRVKLDAVGALPTEPPRLDRGPRHR